MRSLKCLAFCLISFSFLPDCTNTDSSENAESASQAAVDNRANVDGYFITPAASTFKLLPGSMAATTWRYVTDAPATNWQQPGFCETGWTLGEPGFYGGGTVAGDVARTAWPEGKSDLWLRTTFNIATSDIPNAMFWGRWDDTMEVYINGALAATGWSWTSGYRYLGFTAVGRAALKNGLNTIAVHVRDAGGGRYFDLGITLNKTLTDRPSHGFERNATVGAFSNIVKQFMIEQGIPAGVVAVMKKDQVVAKRAFGWKDKSFTTDLPENAVMRLASNDKVITRAAVRAVIDGNTVDPITGERVTENTLVFPLLRAHGLTPIPGATVSSNIDKITIKHLFDHYSGLKNLPDQNTFYADVGVTPGTSTQSDNVRWVYSKDTSFDPGSRYEYSSTGYMVLRYLVQTLKGDLITYLQNAIFTPVGSGDIFLAYERLANRQSTEPWYATLESPSDRWIQLENYTAINASSESLVRFLRRYHIGYGNPLIDPNTGGYLATPDNGWGYYAGGMAGTTSYTIQRRADEVSIAVIFNINGAYDDLLWKLNQQVDNTPANGWGI